MTNLTSTCLQTELSAHPIVKSYLSELNYMEGTPEIIFFCSDYSCVKKEESNELTHNAKIAQKLPIVTCDRGQDSRFSISLKKDLNDPFRLLIEDGRASLSTLGKR